jgi:hypothetical protein
MYSVVKLGVADVIGDATLSVPEIASALPGTPNEDALLRCLRMCAVQGLFVESAGADQEYKFALTDAGALLQTGVPMQPSMACGMLHWNERPTWEGFLALPDYVAGTSSIPPYEQANGKPIFDFYAENPQSAEPFNQFMTFFQRWGTGCGAGGGAVERLRRQDGRGCGWLVRAAHGSRKRRQP